MKNTLFCGLLCVAGMATIYSEDLIESVIIERNKVTVEVNEQFKKKYLMGNFFAEYDEDIDLSKLDYSVQIMPFIMNAISIVWISGKTYYVDSMDKELYSSLKTVKKVLKQLYKKTSWKGKLIPRKLVSNSFVPVKGKKEKVALLFSGGVDSTASSLYHREKDQLLITAWGHWDLPLHDKVLWDIRVKHFKKFAAAYGHTNTFIRSNYSSFLNRPVLDTLVPEIVSWRIFAVEGIGWAGLVAPILLLKGYPVLLHGSTISWDFPFPAAANPFIDNNLKFAGVKLEHDLFDYNRLEKCELLADMVKKGHLEKPFIRVCEEKVVYNCCHCQKCVRTILELIVLQEDPRTYGFSIDLDKAIVETRKFIEDSPMVSTTVWHLGHIKNYLLKREKEGKEIHPDLSWILSLDLSQKDPYDVRTLGKINWLDFIKFLPSIKVPQRFQSQVK
ncbi:hypothetical protein H0X06_06495 [Candidatus Dependentiae bacterium]|nr:hypothetical protein [Candidatus Dependentiae bacterium]